MKRIYTIGILIVSLIMSGTELSHSQRVEKTTREVFDHSSATELEIESKFGEVEILQREGQNVEVVATLWVESNREEHARELLSQLKASIVQVENRIIVKSIFPDKINSLGTKFRIDFRIYTPADIDLVLSSKYGSAFIDKISGHAAISIAYGNLNARNLSRENEKPLNSIDLAYSSGNIEDAGWLKLDLSYSKLSIDKAVAVVVLSKYSSLSVDETSSLVMESKYDTYSIGEINNFLGNLRYGNLKIGELYKKFEIESQYTSVKIGEIASGFEMINIQNQRGSYKLAISDEASFRLKGEAIRGDISVKGMKNMESRSVNADKYIEGSYGGNPSSTVDIVVKEGSVNIEID